MDSNISHHISDFVDHRKTDKAISEDDAYIIVKGRKVPKRTVKGWLLCAELSNGSTEWMELKIAKDAHLLRLHGTPRLIKLQTTLPFVGGSPIS